MFVVFWCIIIMAAVGAGPLLIIVDATNKIIPLFDDFVGKFVNYRHIFGMCFCYYSGDL